MIKYYYIILLFLIASASVSGQQNFTIESNYILFEDAATGEPVLKYNDSMLVRGFKLDTHIKSSFPKDIKASNFSDYHYQINDKNYFVSNGGGLVLELKKNNFKRIDNSFRHKNQFRANHFAHNNALYLWGGYGLFTHKKILTYYDFNLKEWSLKEIKTPKDLKPRLNALHMVYKDNLYIIGGLYRENNTLETKKIADEFVWKLDLKTFKWRKGKKYKSSTEELRYKYLNNSIQIDQKIINIGTYIEEIDLLNDTKKTYQNKSFGTIKNIVYHKKNQFVTYIYSTTDKELRIKSEPLDNLIGELIKNESFYKYTYNQIFISAILALGLIILLLLFFNTHKKNTVKLKNKIIYKSKDNLFYNTNNDPMKLNKMPFDVLKIFLENKNKYVPFSILNQVINDGVGNQNYITINKRRERVCDELTTELSIILKREKKSILKFRKNEIDKRIKEVKLDVEIITI